MLPLLDSKVKAMQGMPRRHGGTHLLPCELPFMHLAGEHDHGIALACVLGVPEDAQFSRPRFALADLLHSLVHPQELMVSGQDLSGLTTGLIRAV